MKRVLVAFLALALVIIASVASFSAAPYPTYGTAVVDGNNAEWDLNADFFANMYRAGNPNKPIESYLYLRYDCFTQTMYALCMKAGADPIIAYPNPEQNWIAIDAQNNKVVSGLSGNDGIPADFEFINTYGPTPPDSLIYADGWEASFPLSPGSYTLIAHAEVWDQIRATVRRWSSSAWFAPSPPPGARSSRCTARSSRVA